MKGSRTELILAAATALLLILTVAGVAYLWSYSTREPATEVADSFMASLRDGDYNRALDMCAPELRTQLQALPAAMERNNLRPTAWSFDDRRFSDTSADLRGTVTIGPDRMSNITMQLAKQQGQWKITSVRFGG